jgi:Coenzyme PQQ synthesis protein D (PqqD)
MRKDSLTPTARKDELVTRELSDELLVYDLKRHKAHCLNQTAAAVWKLCDGKATVKEIAKSLAEVLGAPVDERIIHLALEQLAKFHLLDESKSLVPQLPPELTRMSRREMMRTLGVAAAIALPLIVSVSAPTAVQAASCVETTCTAGGAPCCVGTCQNGLCVSQ